MAFAECSEVAETPLLSPSLPPETLMDSVRRSSRARKSAKKFEDEDYIVATPSKGVPRQPAPANKISRPKRKATVIPAETDVTEDGLVLLDQLVARMTSDERFEYKGWVELESEPVFFNAMLHLLGAEDFKVQELFGVDEFSLDFLLKPVHGLIYLYEYAQGSDSNGTRQDCPQGLWFANQTTTNACATVALMNIIMNARDAAIGPELQAFKDATSPLQPPQRGHLLDKNDWIRSIHNSAARRTDLVSEDLLLDNKFEAAGETRRVRGQKKATRAPRNRKRLVTEQSFHYIAYVPVNGQVWELDGFEVQPRCLGPCTNNDWLQVASISIQSRMEGQQCNLLAVCQSPIRDIVGGLQNCDSKLREEGPRIKERNIKEGDEDTHHLDLDITSPVTPTSLDGHTNRPTPNTISTTAAAVEVGLQPPSPTELCRIRGQRETLKAEYTAEIAARSEGLELLHARQHGYTPAVHRWLRLLSEKGELRGLIAEAAGID